MIFEHYKNAAAYETDLRKSLQVSLPHSRFLELSNAAIESLTRLHLAIINGENDALPILIATVKSHGLLDCQYYKKNTTLHLAAYKRNNTALKLLIEAGASQTIQNNVQEFPLDLTIAYRTHPPFTLLWKNASIQEKIKVGFGPILPKEILKIFLASETFMQTLLNMIEVFHPEWVCPYTRKLMFRPVQYRIADNQVQTCDTYEVPNENGGINYALRTLIVQHVVKKSTENQWLLNKLLLENNFSRIFALAVRYGYFELLQQIVLHTPSNTKDLINATDDAGWSPLHYAASIGATACVEYLHQLNADLSAITPANKTPLELAVQSKHSVTVRYLLRYADQIQIKNALFTALGGDHVYVSKQTEEIIALLLDAITVPFINDSDKDGNTILHLLSKHKGKKALVKKAIERGADFTIVNAKGNTPLHNAVHVKNNQGIVKTLMTLGASTLLTKKNLNNLNPIELNQKAQNACSSCKQSVEASMPVLEPHLNLSGINFFAAHITLKELDISQSNLTKTDLRNSDLTDTNLAEVDLNKASFHKESLLHAKSIMNLKVTRKTLKKNHYDNEDLFRLKLKIVRDYKALIKKSDFKTILQILHKLLKDEKNVLKLLRNSVFEYGNTDAVAAIMDFGRSRLLSLVGFSSLSLDENEEKMLHEVFESNVYSILRNLKNTFTFFSNNAKTSLNYIHNSIIGQPQFELGDGESYQYDNSNIYFK